MLYTIFIKRKAELEKEVQELRSAIENKLGLTLDHESKPYNRMPETLTLFGLNKEIDFLKQVLEKVYSIEPKTEEKELKQKTRKGKNVKNS